MSLWHAPLHVRHTLPEISGCSIFCKSNFTNSMLIAVTGQYRQRRFTHVKIVEILLCSDGGNQPFFLFLRLLKRGARYRVLRWRREWRTARRLSRRFLMAEPRC